MTTQNGKAVQDEVNGKLYRQAGVVRSYATTNLSPPEATAFVRYRSDIQDRRVLDLGCGAGRIATYLRPITTQYLGIDFSHHMIEHCRESFQGMRFEQGDMRTLNLADESYDTVMAVYNLFDIVSHEDRLRALAEVRRVLVPGGMLLFSAHNRNYIHATDDPKLEFQRNPVRLFRGVVDYWKSRFNRRRLKPLQKFEDDYAVINDCGHNYGVLHYYITRDAQARQLAGAGFELIEMLDEVGRTLRPGDDDSAYSMIYYVARTLK